jgi:hypothetical protein
MIYTILKNVSTTVRNVTTLRGSSIPFLHSTRIYGFEVRMSFVLWKREDAHTKLRETRGMVKVKLLYIGRKGIQWKYTSSRSTKAQEKRRQANTTPRLLYPQGTSPPAHTEWVAGWATGPVWMKRWEKSFAPAEIRISDRTARSPVTI